MLFHLHPVAMRISFDFASFVDDFTCSPSWLSVSPLIPLREFGDDAYEHTPLSGIAGDYRVTICFASLGDLQVNLVPRVFGQQAPGTVFWLPTSERG